jgi:hypothetical protein
LGKQQRQTLSHHKHKPLTRRQLSLSLSPPHFFPLSCGCTGDGGGQEFDAAKAAILRVVPDAKVGGLYKLNPDYP